MYIPLYLESRLAKGPIRLSLWYIAHSCTFRCYIYTCKCPVDEWKANIDPQNGYWPEPVTLGSHSAHCHLATLLWKPITGKNSFTWVVLCSLLRSEKRAGSLKEENTNLRKAEANYKDLEEQCAKLKRRNAELASAVKVSNTRCIESRIDKIWRTIYTRKY